MTGHSDTQRAGGHLNVLWPDAEFENLSADYDLVVVELQESTGSVVQVRCHGYIGYERVGAWDEVVVESAALTECGGFLSRCTKAIEKTSAAIPESGSSDRNLRHWAQLEILFIDGSRLGIVASRFVVARPE